MSSLDAQIAALEHRIVNEAKTLEAAANLHDQLDALRERRDAQADRTPEAAYKRGYNSGYIAGKRAATTPVPSVSDEGLDVERLHSVIRRIALREGHPGHSDLRSGLTTPGLGHGYEVTLAGAIAEEYSREA